MLGGVSTAVETLRRTLERLGHDVVVIAPRMAGACEPTPGVMRVPAVPAPTYPDFSLPLPVLRGLARRMEALGLDVFHAQHPFLLGATARRLARRLGRPLVFTYHTLYDKYAHYVPLPRPVVADRAVAWSTRFANSADLVIAPSAGLAARLRGQGVRRPVQVLPTGVDLGLFQPGDRAAARAALGLPAAPLLLYVGRLDREKNLTFLLDAFERIAVGHPTVQLVLVGRGTQEKSLRHYAAGLAARARVRFGGGVPQAQVVRYYQAADVFAFTSTTETQGLAVLEAMASGLPVVAVRASGVEEAVVDGVTGLLTPEDREVFAAAVLEVLADPGLAGKLASGAREGAQPFAADALGARLCAIYQRLRAGIGPDRAVE
ncbi:MAG TPA: glycosyltransferase [Methylomirabilota bacterium]|jgi:glycosyltransferase involved in cell wall biosynthesis|nr:glycosyltransferase [Methylomirabilota bacterium]